MNKRKKLLLAIIACVIILFSILIGYTYSKYVKSVPVAGGGVIAKWSFDGFLTNTSSILLAAYVVYKQSNIICKLQLISDKSKQRVALYRNVVLLLLLVIPFFVLAGEFYRYVFAILPVIYAVYSNFWNYKIMIPKNSWVRYAYFALLSIFWPAFLYIIGMKTHNVLSTLTDNMLFNG